MIYLDNCSTTKPREEVIKVINETMIEDFGNPGSLHRLGINSERRVKNARGIIAEYLKADEREIYFTSGGTESNNIAIQSIVNKYSRKGKHIITTAIEHPAILNTMKHYEKIGYEVTYLKVDEYGQISLDELRDAIRDDTILVSVIHVNNEVGALQNIFKIKEIIMESRAKPLLHLDGVQSFGKMHIDIKSLGADTFAFSGHKIHGPKGIGGLYVNKKLNLEPIIFGGNQERGLRSGTENVPGITGMGEAVRILAEKGNDEMMRASQIKAYMAEKLIQEIEDTKINTSLDSSSSEYILSATFRNTRAEVLLHYLEDKKIYVSTSSACSSKGTSKSHVLKAIGLKDREIEGTIRFCFSHEISMEDIDYTIEVLKESVQEIRSITRGRL